MDSSIEISNLGELDNPPTLVAESEKEKGIRARGLGLDSSRMSTDSGEDKTAMPVLQPNVSLDAGVRSKSGRIRKPARNYDEYVVPNMVKRRIPPTTPTSISGRASVTKSAVASPTTASGSSSNSAASSPAVSVAPSATSPPPDVDAIRLNMERKFPKALNVAPNAETPFRTIQTVCFKEIDYSKQILPIAEIHAKIRESYKVWAKGPYRLREDEVKFVQECIVKPDWKGLPMKDWRLLAEILKDRTARMRKRFARPTKAKAKAKRRREDVKKCFLDLGNKFVVGKQLPHSDDDFESEDFDLGDESLDEDETSNPSSRVSTRSKDATTKDRSGSKASSVVNDADMDLSLGSVGMDEFAGEDLKEELFDDLENVLVSETNRRGNNGNSMVAALHATLQKDGGPEFDPSQYEPPALEKDSAMFALDDMEESTNACSFFENIKEPSFENAETPTGLTDEAFAELEQRVEEDEDKAASLIGNDYAENLYEQESDAGNLKQFEEDKFDVGSLEVEESSGSIKFSSSAPRSEFSGPGSGTMISTKTALMCALKISEEFLPSSHEKYLERLEETDKYQPEDLDDIRKKFNMPPSPLVGKRKMKPKSNDDSETKKSKGAPKPVNGNDKPKPKGLPFLRSAYARCRKFVEDEVTVLEKLGNNKLLAAGEVIEIDYENYVKEADIEIPFDDDPNPMPSLPPPTVSNCHAPTCRLGCICLSISQDYPARNHCARQRCIFECTCQNILVNNGDDGDIRSRLRPRVSLLNWRAESTEKEKEPMTSYRQMERGTHFVRMRRHVDRPERLRREFVLDGKVVERSTAKVKVTKERLRTKALIHSSHRRIMAKPAESQRFVRIVPAKQEPKKKTVEQLKKKCAPLTVDVTHLDVEITDAKTKAPVPTPVKYSRRILTPDQLPIARISRKDFEEMKSIIQEMTEDVQLLVIDKQIVFVSWEKKTRIPRVKMYQGVKNGDQIKVPWLYIPIPPSGHSWICHELASSFEETEFIQIPEIKGMLSSPGVKLGMNSAIANKKCFSNDVQLNGKPSQGKFYIFPDLPKALIIGPFKTEQSTVNPRDLATADKISKMIENVDKLKSKGKTGFGEESYRRFASTPTVFPIKKRNDGQVHLPPEESRVLFQRIAPTILPRKQVMVKGHGSNGTPVFKMPLPPPPPKFSKVSFNWSQAVKLVGFTDVRPTNTTTPREISSWTEIITL